MSRFLFGFVTLEGFLRFLSAYNICSFMAGRSSYGMGGLILLDMSLGCCVTQHVNIMTLTTPTCLYFACIFYLLFLLISCICVTKINITYTKVGVSIRVEINKIILYFHTVWPCR